MSSEAVSLGHAIDDAKMSKRHKRFWLLAALGILLDGFDFFIIGVVNPLLKQQYGLSATTLGLVSAAAIVGAIFGAGLLGPPGRIGHGGRPVIEQLHANRPRLTGQLLHLLEAKTQLQAGGIHHLGEQQGFGGPAPHQLAKNPVAHPRQGGLQHPAGQLARRAPAGQR